VLGRRILEAGEEAQILGEVVGVQTLEEVVEDLKPQIQEEEEANFPFQEEQEYWDFLILANDRILHQEEVRNQVQNFHHH